MIAYTDGSTHPKNPGPGGFGVVFLNDAGQLISTYSKQTSEITTNNREEIKAILYAASQAILKGEHITIYSDSAYAIGSLSTWIDGWASRGWKKSDGGTPENLDLIQAYYNLPRKNLITMEKVKGHSSIKYNELADRLAKGEQVDLEKNF